MINGSKYTFLSENNMLENLFCNMWKSPCSCMIVQYKDSILLLFPCFYITFSIKNISTFLKIWYIFDDEVSYLVWDYRVMNFYEVYIKQYLCYKDVISWLVSRFQVTGLSDPVTTFSYHFFIIIYLKYRNTVKIVREKKHF